MEAQAKLRKFRMSARKVRLLADLIRGREVQDALAQLDNQVKVSALPLKKLLLSAIANWQQKAGEQLPKKDSSMYLSVIYVDEAGMLKRIRPSAKGRTHRIRKRSSHVTMIVSQEIEDIVTENKQIKIK